MPKTLSIVDSFFSRMWMGRIALNTLTRSLLSICLIMPSLSFANEAEQYPSVADNIAAMDKDHDGIVTVYEVRAFIESKHGKNYQKKVLDDMESSAKGKSCATPFAQSFY
ncbi:hypothetical protein [Methylovorus sp. MM2]|uniref:hypothetical protein n=1 Tax=Methylovorus sp. MM2 TaxID=1848038 RepID=UPI0010420354|nr:hypothetical protein [Methylovorus sp. MM2]